MAVQLGVCVQREGGEVISLENYIPEPLHRRCKENSNSLLKLLFVSPAGSRHTLSPSFAKFYFESSLGCC